MMGYLLTQGATVLCQHGGRAQPMITNLRVKINGQAIVTQSNMFTVSACTYSPGHPSPCTTVQWIRAAARVKAGGVPVLLKDSQAICIPNGTGVNIVMTQLRVKGT